MLSLYGVESSVSMDLANWGPSGQDWTTKIFQTGPTGPGPDLLEKECDETLQKHTRFWLCWMLMYGLFSSLCLLSFYSVNNIKKLILLKRTKSNVWQTVLVKWIFRRDPQEPLKFGNKPMLKNLMIVPGSKKEVLRGPFGNFEVLNRLVL